MNVDMGQVWHPRHEHCIYPLGLTRAGAHSEILSVLLFQSVGLVLSSDG